MDVKRIHSFLYILFEMLIGIAFTHAHERKAFSSLYFFCLPLFTYAFAVNVFSLHMFQLCLCCTCHWLLLIYLSILCFCSAITMLVSHAWLLFKFCGWLCGNWIHLVSQPHINFINGHWWKSPACMIYKLMVELKVSSWLLGNWSLIMWIFGQAWLQRND